MDKRRSETAGTSVGGEAKACQGRGPHAPTALFLVRLAWPDGPSRSEPGPGSTWPGPCTPPPDPPGHKEQRSLSSSLSACFQPFDLVPSCAAGPGHPLLLSERLWEELPPSSHSGPPARRTTAKTGSCGFRQLGAEKPQEKLAASNISLLSMCSFKPSRPKRLGNHTSLRRAGLPGPVLPDHDLD